MKTPKPRKPPIPDVSVQFKVYGGTRLQVIPSLQDLQYVLVNKDHPQYGQDAGSQYFFTDHQGALSNGFNKAPLTWELIDQLCQWRTDMRKWQENMHQWCLDNGVAPDAEEA